MATGLAAALVLVGCGADEATRELEERGAENLQRCLEDRGVAPVTKPEGRVVAAAGPSTPPAVVNFSVETARRPLELYVVWRSGARPELAEVRANPEQYTFIGVADSGSLIAQRASEDCLV